MLRLFHNWSQGPKISYLGDILLLLSLLHSRSLLVEPFLLLRLRLGSVLVEKFECLGGSVTVKSVLELGDRGGDFEAHVQDLLLALQPDVLGPSVADYLVRMASCNRGLPQGGKGEIRT